MTQAMVRPTIEHPLPPVRQLDVDHALEESGTAQMNSDDGENSAFSQASTPAGARDHRGQLFAFEKAAPQGTLPAKAAGAQTAGLLVPAADNVDELAAADGPADAENSSTSDGGASRHSSSEGRAKAREATVALLAADGTLPAMPTPPRPGFSPQETVAASGCKQPPPELSGEASLDSGAAAPVESEASTLSLTSNSTPTPRGSGWFAPRRTSFGSVRRPQATPPAAAQADLRSRFAGNAPQQKSPPLGPAGAEPAAKPAQADEAVATPEHTAGESRFNDAYDVLNKLGEGSYAAVYKCVHRESRQEFAVKMLYKSKARTAELQGLMYEAEILSGLQHDYIVGLHDQYEGPQILYLVLDFVEGSTLFDRIIAAEHFSESLAAGVYRNLISAIAYIHKHNIAHRDIKPENLLMKRKALPADHPQYEQSMTEVVVADFGLATTCPARSCCGSPAYIAPEVLSGERYGVSCDLWSLGIVLYVMLAGVFPFKGSTHRETFNCITTRALTFVPPTVWAQISPDAKDFVRRLLIKDAEERMTAETAAQHPWLTGVDLLVSSTRNIHMEGTVSALKTLRFREKVAAAMTVFKAAKLMPLQRLKHTPKLADGTLPETPETDSKPAWRRYILSPSNLSFAIPVQSQTNSEKSYVVDLSILRLVGTAKPDFKLQCICTCPSKKVCRHIQYVYQHLFVGDRHTETMPVFNAIETTRKDLVESIRCGSADAAGRDLYPHAAAAGVSLLGVVAGALSPPAARWGKRLLVACGLSLSACCAGMYAEHVRAAEKLRGDLSRLALVSELLLAVADFKRLFELVPDGEKKSVLNFEPRPPRLPPTPA
ncbi:Myosin light chain kinase A [Diplonema papillatum]|nr:Myosin light chain kinase A [Diplonema papillatum]